MRHLELQRYLSRTAARRVRLRLTDDRGSVVRTGGGDAGDLSLTLHGMFLDAPGRVLRALARFVSRPDPRLRREVIRLYRQTGLDRTGRTRSRPVTLRHGGQVHDLKRLYDGLNEEYFGGRLRALITWGRRSGTPARRSVHFGSYNWERRLIRINPRLDSTFVPRYFVRYIIYHEMLHAEIGVRIDAAGRRWTHTREFQRRERAFRHYDRAREWERRNFRRFLRTDRTSPG